MVDLQKNAPSFAKDNKQSYNIDIINLNSKNPDKLQRIGLIEGPDLKQGKN